MTRKAIGQEVKEELLAQLAEGRSLRSICRQKGMPALRTVIGWLRDDDEFRQLYAEARTAGADAHADELRDLAQQALDNPQEAQAIRVAADILKWTASKLKPKSYGERIEQTIVTEPSKPEEVEARVRLLEEQLGISPRED